MPMFRRPICTTHPKTSSLLPVVAHANDERHARGAHARSVRGPLGLSIRQIRHSWGAAGRIGEAGCSTGTNNAFMRSFCPWVNKFMQASSGSPCNSGPCLPCCKPRFQARTRSWDHQNPACRPRSQRHRIHRRPDVTQVPVVSHLVGGGATEIEWSLCRSCVSCGGVIAHDAVGVGRTSGN